MTGIPFLMHGRISDVDGTTVMANTKVIFKNNTNTGAVSVTTNASGDYVRDLADMTSGAVLNDSISVKARISSGRKIKIETFTITQADIDKGMKELDLTLLGVREHIFKTIEGIYTDNLPANFTDTKGTGTVSWALVAAFPEKDPTFPCIVIEPVRLSLESTTFDNAGTGLNSPINVTTMFYSRARHGKERVDIGRDFMENVIIDNEDTLVYAGLVFDRPEWVDDSTVGDIIFSGQKYNLGTQIVKFKWRP